ncbi:hypothetical protein P280DRAFT_263315 [Massarina eburnea CBS 473.64]|uniref:Uncharacterized protein n=1 Tax=Massarina eburnea CBS 473.64 TaxID=1395130 RepID=A0A6A6S430_9PLEO|nr:hypothetical protein P280DRAFT_263315 [Massarina eburnea CBS 473.64]
MGILRNVSHRNPFYTPSRPLPRNLVYQCTFSHRRVPAVATRASTDWTSVRGRELYIQKRMEEAYSAVMPRLAKWVGDEGRKTAHVELVLDQKPQSEEASEERLRQILENLTKLMWKERETEIAYRRNYTLLPTKVENRFKTHFPKSKRLGKRCRNYTHLYAVLMVQVPLNWCMKFLDARHSGDYSMDDFRDEIRSLSEKRSKPFDIMVNEAIEGNLALHCKLMTASEVGALQDLLKLVQDENDVDKFAAGLERFFEILNLPEAETAKKIYRDPAPITNTPRDTQPSQEDSSTELQKVEKENEEVESDELDELDPWVRDMMTGSSDSGPDLFPWSGPSDQIPTSESVEPTTILETDLSTPPPTLQPQEAVQESPRSPQKT